MKLLNGMVRPAYGEVDKTSPWFGKPTFEIRYAPDEALSPDQDRRGQQQQASHGDFRVVRWIKCSFAGGSVTRRCL